MVGRPDDLPNPWEDEQNLPHPSDYEGDGEYDSNGRQYNPHRGSRIQYTELCGALLSNSMERYGESRFCTATPLSYYNEGEPPYCKVHKYYADRFRMDHYDDLFEHGAFAKSYLNIFKRLEGWSKVQVVESFAELLELSEHEFDEETVEKSIDLEDGEGPFDAIEKELPVPQVNKPAARALWRACLDMERMDRINLQILEDGVERERTVDTDDDGEPVTARDEHHLHLTLSRITKNQEKNLEAGGVKLDAGADVEITNKVGDSNYVTADELESEDVVDSEFTDVLSEDD